MIDEHIKLYITERLKKQATENLDKEVMKLNPKQVAEVLNSTTWTLEVVIRNKDSAYARQLIAFIVEKQYNDAAATFYKQLVEEFPNIATGELRQLRRLIEYETTRADRAEEMCWDLKNELTTTKAKLDALEKTTTDLKALVDVLHEEVGIVSKRLIIEKNVSKAKP